MTKVYGRVEAVRGRGRVKITMRLNQIGTEHSPHGTTRKTKMHDPRSWRCPWGSFLFSKPSISLVPWRNSRTMKTKTWCYGHDHIISRGKIVP